MVGNPDVPNFASGTALSSFHTPVYARLDQMARMHCCQSFSVSMRKLNMNNSVSCLFIAILLLVVKYQFACKLHNTKSIVLYMCMVASCLQMFPFHSRGNNWSLPGQGDSPTDGQLRKEWGTFNVIYYNLKKFYFFLDPNFFELQQLFAN